MIDFLIILVVVLLFYISYKYQDKLATNILSILVFAAMGGMGLLLIVGGLSLLYELITNYKNVEDPFTYICASFWLPVVGGHWMYGVYKFTLKKGE